jgi:hypothetical protein
MGEQRGFMGRKTERYVSVEKRCAFCEFGTAITLSTGEEPDIICEKRGIVPSDYVCRSFQYDLLKREPKKISGLVDDE